MENVLVKYSDFFNDDGGFDKIRKDFDDLGSDLIKKAKEVKQNVKIFDLDDTESVKEAEAQTESLVKAFKKLGDARKDVSKLEEAYQKELKQTNQTEDERIEKLVKLDKRLQEQKTNLKELNKLGTQNGEVIKDVNEARVEATVEIKKINKEIQKNQKEILKSNELSREEQKLLKAKIILEKDEIKTLGDVRERISALRTVVQSLDLDTQADQIKLFNDEINDLTEMLGDNSDKFIQSKINIGNYEESIVNALKGSNLFTGQLSVLNGAIDGLVEKLFASKVANEKDTVAKNVNTKATKGLGKSIRVLNNIAKASGIVILIGLLVSLGSAFSQGRAGAVLAEKAIARSTVTARVFINVLGDVGQGLIRIFKGIGNSFGSFIDEAKIFILEFKKGFAELPEVLGGSEDEVEKLNKRIVALRVEIANNKAQNNYSEGWDKITTAISGAGDQIDNAVASLKTLDDASIKAFQIADAIKLQELALIGLRKEVALLEIESTDSTISLNTQLKATEELLDRRLGLLRGEKDIALQNLALANAKARADAQAGGFSVGNIKDEVEFSKQLLALNIRLDESKGENTLNDEFLNASQEALKEYLTALNELPIAEKEIAKQRREITRDIFEQNIDLLFDLIDTEKNISEAFVNDVTNNFQKRLNEFNAFLIKFKDNSQRILDEFSKEANNLGLDLDFEIEFDKDGNFEVFIGDTKLATDNIVELNEQLQSTGLNEIDVNRFREFIIETRNGVRDFRELNKELKLAGINISELANNIVFTQDELNALDNLQAKIDQLVVSSRGKLSKKERQQVLKDLEALEKQKQAITEFAEFERLTDRKRAIDEELNLVEFESQRYYELLQERLDIEKQLRDKSVQEGIDKTKEANKKSLEEYKKFGQEVRQVLEAVLDKAVEVQKVRIERAEEGVDKQEELIDVQRRRAEEGLTNSLAFEQRELGKRESEKIKQEQRLERLEKIKALYSSYNNYASQGDGEGALVKALRDFAILESITASFGDGGVVEDKLPTNGVFRGRSHQGRGGGIPILVEGREGILSAREMDNLGKDNFYKMKDLASFGKVDSNFFSKQGESFVQGVPVSSSNSELINEMKDVKRAIEGKPVQQVDVIKLADGTIEVIEKVLTKNKIKRNHYKIRKPRL